jgi:hypothetical protein
MLGRSDRPIGPSRILARWPSAAGLSAPLRYEQTAVPFDWRFTRTDLDDLLRRLDEKEQLTAPLP